MYSRRELEDREYRYYCDLKDGTRKVKYSESLLRCPFCSRDRDYEYQDLLRHASAIGGSSHTKDVRDRARHLALERYMRKYLRPRERTEPASTYVASSRITEEVARDWRSSSTAQGESLLNQTLSYLPTKDLVKTSVLASRWKNLRCLASLDCLPDELLVHILSFLPTKLAASTSLLSKRWRTLCAFRHKFEFLYDFISEPRGAAFNPYRVTNIQKSFVDFVDRSLALQGGHHLNKFSIQVREFGREDTLGVDRWICNALERGVSELQLGIDTRARNHLPSTLFTSTTLVKLSIGTNLYICGLPSDVSLPALKVLFLDVVWFEAGKFSQLFLPGCPALEDLTIHKECFFIAPDVVSSKTIKRLSVICDADIGSSGLISLDTPGLVDLYYSDYTQSESLLFNLDSLAKATLDLSFEEVESPEPPVQFVTGLIRGVRNVKILHLTSSAVEVISVCCKGGLPVVFHNLVKLVFSSKRRRGWKVLLPLLLERSPNLNTLLLSGLYHYTYRRHRHRHRFVGIRVPPNNQVKMLRILKCQGKANELKHIRHLLLNMDCLELVKVHVAPVVDDPKKVRFTENLLKLPTASPKLKMKVV